MSTIPALLMIMNRWDYIPRSSQRSWWQAPSGSRLCQSTRAATTCWSAHSTRRCSGSTSTCPACPTRRCASTPMPFALSSIISDIRCSPRPATTEPSPSVTAWSTQTCSRNVLLTFLSNESIHKLTYNEDLDIHLNEWQLNVRLEDKNIEFRTRWLSPLRNWPAIRTTMTLGSCACSGTPPSLGSYRQGQTVTSSCGHSFCFYFWYFRPPSQMLSMHSGLINFNFLLFSDDNNVHQWSWHRLR